MREVISEAIDLICEFEGLRLEAYKCTAGVWTIGYGHTSGVKQGDKITQQQAMDYLIQDLKTAQKRVDKYDSKYKFNDDEYGALVSFAYNIGNIDQLSQNGTRTKQQIGEAIVLYNKASGKVLAGLVRRRLAEQQLFFSYRDMDNAHASTLKPDAQLSIIAKRGMQGELIKFVQKMIVYLMEKEDFFIAPNFSDGIFGSQTESLVKEFQKINGLTPDGIVGIKTFTKIAWLWCSL